MPSIIRLIDSHTAGEPTRVVVGGGPTLIGRTMIERRAELARHWDHLRSAICAEPRGSDGAVVAFLTEPEHADSLAGVVFGNAARFLGMCGHGTIGVARTLAHLGMIPQGASAFALDTPAGTVAIRLTSQGSVEIRNVPSYVHAIDVSVYVPNYGRITGDIAYGGNWFFLVDLDRNTLQPPVELGVKDIPRLTAFAAAIRAALRANDLSGRDAAEIDHVELFGKPTRTDADAKNFVLCPDGAYDRSPCGTGTSAKMAALAAHGELREGDSWRQESIIGSLFVGRISHARDGTIVPFIQGSAYITAETTLHFDDIDPFRYGIPPVIRTANA